MTESTVVSDARIPQMTREVRSPGEPPTPIVETTDGYRWTQMDHQRGAVELYRHIEGPWYLGYVAN